MDLFHIQTRRLWAGIRRGNAETMLQAIEAGAAVNAWCLQSRENHALRSDVRVDFFQRPILAAAIAEQYDMVRLLMSDPKVRLNAVYAARPSLDCSLGALFGACRVLGGWDDVIQQKFSKLKRPRCFFFSLADIVRLNQTGESALMPDVSQIVLSRGMTAYLDQALKKRKVISRDEIPNIAAVLSKMADIRSYTR